MFTFENGFHKNPEVFRYVVQGGRIHAVNTKEEIALMAGKRGRWKRTPDAIAVWSVTPKEKVEFKDDEVHTNGTFYGWLVWQE